MKVRLGAMERDVEAPLFDRCAPGFGIVDARGYWLAEPTASRGSAAGVGRVVTTEVGRALLCACKEDAQALLEKEFDKDDVRLSGWHVREATR